MKEQPTGEGKVKSSCTLQFHEACDWLLQSTDAQQVCGRSLAKVRFKKKYGEIFERICIFYNLL